MKKIEKITNQNQIGFNADCSNLECVTAKQLAPILGVSYSTIKNYTKSGLIPSIKIGKAVRYNVHQVQQALFAKSEDN